eukprot:22395-Prorocentrum_lima.AAC.1
MLQMHSLMIVAAFPVINHVAEARIDARCCVSCDLDASYICLQTMLRMHALMLVAAFPVILMHHADGCIAS